MIPLRKTGSLWLAGCLSLCLNAADPEIQPTTLALSADEVIQLALARNHTIRIERIEPEIAAQALRRERGIFDPELQAEYRYERSEIAAYNNALSEDAAARFGIGGLLPWGTQYQLAFSANDRTTPFEISSGVDQIITAGDSVSTFGGVTLTQPLLRGFGLGDTYAGVRIARNRMTHSEEAFRASLMDTLSQALRAYYQLYYAEQNLVIARRTKDNAAQLLRDNRRRIETGSMAPLDIYQAESEVALRESIVISAERFRRQAENRLKTFITDNPMDIHSFSILIEELREPVELKVDPVQDYPVALEHRPDYRQVQLGLDIRELELTRSRSQALPRFDLVASYGRSATDKTLSNSVSRLSDDGSDRYTFGAVFSYPLFNRSRDAARTSQYLRRNQTRLLQSQLEQFIMVELDDAAVQLDTSWRRVLSTREARRLAEQSLRAEERKLEVGNTSTFFVLSLQGDLGTAEIRETEALVDYFNAVLEYERVRGTLLKHLRVKVDS